MAGTTEQEDHKGKHLLEIELKITVDPKSESLHKDHTKRHDQPPNGHQPKDYQMTNSVADLFTNTASKSARRTACLQQVVFPAMVQNLADKYTAKGADIPEINEIDMHVIITMLAAPLNGFGVSDVATVFIPLVVKELEARGETEVAALVKSPDFKKGRQAGKGSQAGS